MAKSATLPSAVLFMQLRIKVPTGADVDAAVMVAAAVIVIWGGIFYVLVKAISFWLF
jgi:hypothetical protein